MLIRHPSDIPPSQITPEQVYLNRRSFMAGALALAALPACGEGPKVLGDGTGLTFTRPEAAGYRASDVLTPYEHVTGYNNFYELGTAKDDPARNAGSLKSRPWSLMVEGACAKPGPMDIEDILRRFPLEERIYRLRCVEAWSMVIPWVGFPLSALLKAVEPTADARYVAFESIMAPEALPGQQAGGATLDWPYIEGLRMDEAMHPLTLLAVGLYGKILPNQNGAPIRLVVPWKYGFKSIKSIVRIRLLSERPKTTWNTMASAEYGFYANVNPQVDHPRWSQKTERRLPTSLLSANRIPTTLFNGYAEQVASLYQGLDLVEHY